MEIGLDVVPNTNSLSKATKRFVYMPIYLLPDSAKYEGKKCHLPAMATTKQKRDTLKSKYRFALPRFFGCFERIPILFQFWCLFNFRKDSFDYLNSMQGQVKFSITTQKSLKPKSLKSKAPENFQLGQLSNFNDSLPTSFFRSS